VGSAISHDMKYGDEETQRIVQYVVKNKLVGKEYKGKGGFGQYLEEQYFGKMNDNKSLPDFDCVGVELKVSPLKTLQNGEVRVKERLVLNHFTYGAIAKETFETSSFMRKDSKILIVFYAYDANSKDFSNVRVVKTLLWDTLKHDYAQIKADWETIANKVKAGLAHEISEGDTLYLGACTKGADAESSMQKQPYSDMPARGRAFCFKTSYINHIFALATSRELQETSCYESAASFAERIDAITRPYHGMSGKNILIQLLGKDSSAKHRLSMAALSMLGFDKKKQFYEFDAANIQVKTIRIEGNGSIRESMSFKNIVYTDIVNDEWESSTFYQELVSKFVFMIFRAMSDRNDYYFDKALV